MTASNEALGYVSYPTAVLAKSSKLIPTMIVGSWMEQKSFKLQEWFSALLITGGIAIFNISRLSKNHLNQSDDSDSDSIFGIFLLILSLAMDGLLASCQDSLKKTKQGKYRIPSALESMLWVNAYAILFMLPLSIYNGQFANGCKLLSMGLLQPKTKQTVAHTPKSSSFWITFQKRIFSAKVFCGRKKLEMQSTSRHSNSTPYSLSWAIILLNLTAAAGQIFIFFTIALFSPLTCTTITTTRKFCTILLSVWKYGHVVTPLQWIAIGMVFGGLYLAILSKFTTSNKQKVSLVSTTSSGKEKGD
jgi:UDP-galactose transporter B1